MASARAQLFGRFIRVLKSCCVPPPPRFVRRCVQRLAAAAGVERPAREGEVEPWCDAGVCDKVERLAAL